MLKLTKVWKPEVYQGRQHPKKYFEGWYFKIVNKDEDSIYALIPGVSYGIDGSKPHSFIQLIDGKSCKSLYQTYDIHDFHYSKDNFRLWIGANYFSSGVVDIDLAADSFSLKGRLNFENSAPWPVSLFSPGIMGWYAFVPFMECYHGIISMKHDISGSLAINNRSVDFTGGRGYMEKDWGRSFPSSWIWMQSNYFENPNVFFTASIARIPWFGKFFTGLIAGLSINGKLYRFATYTGARIEQLSHQSGNIRIRISDKHIYLEIHTRESNSGKLYSPRNGSMEDVIDESMSSEIKVTLGQVAYGNRKIIFEGTGRNSGLEIVGDIAELQPH
ncbi:MAG TPA: tocopherol cyclase family protein [Clostridia bacterium]|nr:tocopherol cyclase family protein [Clostridia bacterium]